MKQQLRSPLVLLQTIAIIWTKRSRGGKDATLRNHLPEAFALPADLPWPAGHTLAQTADVLYQHILFGERSHFQSPLWQQWHALVSQLPETSRLPLYGADSRGFRMPPLDVSSSSTLQVAFHWEQMPGAPRRFPKQEQFALQPGQWAQVRFNARSHGSWVHEETWYYLKYVLNIGYTLTFKPTFFLESVATHHVSQLADLW